MELSSLPLQGICLLASRLGMALFKMEFSYFHGVLFLMFLLKIMLIGNVSKHEESYRVTSYFSLPYFPNLSISLKFLGASQATQW